MRLRSTLPLMVLPMLAAPWGCTGSNVDSPSSSSATTSGEAGAGGLAGAASSSSTGDATGGSGGSSSDPDGGVITDAGDAACMATASEATVGKLPTDIIMMVDNSTSMEPAVAQVR
ncbi:MAG TPA: hypothetical protein PK156_41330, partial [Polyangium sp.]|nr:hypothetical protein [Polyangium sp.]